jgi:hypothetical protein
MSSRRLLADGLRRGDPRSVLDPLHSGLGSSNMQKNNIAARLRLPE